MQNFRALGVPPPDSRASAAGGFASRPPASGGWGLRPHNPNGLRQRGTLPHDPKISPPHCEFLATRLGWRLVVLIALLACYLETIL